MNAGSVLCHHFNHRQDQAQVQTSWTLEEYPDTNPQVPTDDTPPLYHPTADAPPAYNKDSGVDKTGDV